MLSAFSDFLYLCAQIGKNAFGDKTWYSSQALDANRLYGTALYGLQQGLFAAPVRLLSDRYA